MGVEEFAPCDYEMGIMSSDSVRLYWTVEEINMERKRFVSVSMFGETPVELELFKFKNVVFANGLYIINLY